MPNADVPEPLMCMLIPPLAVGDRLRHYKGGEYRVLAFSLHSETREPLVTYESTTDGTRWTRPQRMMHEDVGGGCGARFVRHALAAAPGAAADGLRAALEHAANVFDGLAEQQEAVADGRNTTDPRKWAPIRAQSMRRWAAECRGALDAAARADAAPAPSQPDHGNDPHQRGGGAYRSWQR